MPRPTGAAEGARQRLARRRQRARVLRAAGKSYREIARLLGVSLGSAHALANHVPGTGAPPPPPRANQRARRHGGYSEVSLGQLVDKYSAAAVERWPHLDPAALADWARLAARVEMAGSAELANGVVTADGRVS